MPKAKASWFRMSAANMVGEISILGDIGGFGVSAQDFSDALDALGPVSAMNIAINSDGGDVHTGFAIYNMLAMHPAQKTVTVMGLAASMASVVAMAGDTRIMPENTMLMIHNPVGQVAGQSQEIIEFGKAVGTMRNNIAQIYADTSGQPKKDMLALMDKQSWIGAKQAKALGLVTDVVDPIKIAAKFDISRFANAPAAYDAATPKWECGASRDLPLSTQGTWDGPAAAARMLDDAGIGGDSPNLSKAKRGFLAVDSANANLRGSYKLPFADLSGGTLKASPAGIRAAASRLPNTDIPQSVKDTARAVLTAYENKAKGKTMKTETDNAVTDEMRAEIRKSERESILAQQKQVVALCRIAGKPQLANEYNQADMTVEAVVAKLDELAQADAAAAKKRAPTRSDRAGTGAFATGGDVDLNAHHNPNVSDGGTNVIDPGKIWGGWNNKKRA